MTGTASPITLALAGETLCTRRHSSYDDAPFTGLVDLIRDADVSVTNLETRIHTFKGYPMPTDTMGHGQSYQQADPFVAEELRWMGFDMIARSNNHGMDFGPEMVEEEGEILDAAGFVHAGAGMNLAAATRPAFFETPRGRVALISLCTDFPPHCPAGEQRPDMQGRPGINAFHFDTRYELDTAAFDSLKTAMQDFGLANRVKGDRIISFDQLFVEADRSQAIHTARQADLDRNIRAISEARRAADYVVIHIHQSTKTGHRAADRIQTLCRSFIDAGADVILGDGPHVLQGVEIYKGRPIFYSLGNFFYQSETIKRFPAEFYERAGLSHDATPQDALDFRDSLRTGRTASDKVIAGRTGDAYMKWFEALLAEVVFEGPRLVEIRLHPVWNYHERRSQRGLPRLAPDEHAADILRRMQDYSAEWGTHIRLSENVGYIHPA
ncbi:CapA family protein [Agrobacterium vitis]|uniref:CapA family protein n=1 Tax=Agrobacterium vitis TaxID=373 RepID=UPI001F482A4E|nr:CapA family protein [Agrobacterium vitis]MCE6076415.1 CapA family protein [Agrobacterium vitis]